MQHQAWSQARITNGSARLAAVKAAGLYRPDREDPAWLVQAVGDAGRRPGAGPAVRRGLAVAG